VEIRRPHFHPERIKRNRPPRDDAGQERAVALPRMMSDQKKICRPKKNLLTEAHDSVYTGN
jgi:hypothetical protein